MSSKIVRKSDIVTVSLPQGLKQQTAKYAIAQDTTFSQIVKLALKSYLARGEWRRLQEVFAPAGAKLGLRTDEDVEKYFN